MKIVLNITFSVLKMFANVPQLGEVADFETLTFNLALKFI